MAKFGFNFNDKQRNVLCTCWKRPRERKVAAIYLQDVERAVADLEVKLARNQPTPIKQQIALANNLRSHVEGAPELLEQLPQDFESLLATVWLQKKYVDEYFELHSEACRKDKENNTARKLMLSAVVRGWIPAKDKEISHQLVDSGLSKLPPNYFQHDKTDADFLRIVASAAGEIAWFLKGSKAWTQKPIEERLILSLVFLYEHHFGKLPSAANKGRDGYLSPFRCFLNELSKILSENSSHLREYKLGSDITRRALTAIRKNRSS